MHLKKFNHLLYATRYSQRALGNLVIRRGWRPNLRLRLLIEKHIPSSFSENRLRFPPPPGSAPVGSLLPPLILLFIDMSHGKIGEQKTKTDSVLFRTVSARGKWSVVESTFPGVCMNLSNVSSLHPMTRSLNAVALQNAVLCAECDVVSDSPHDMCLVCGSRSLVNISRMLGGTLPRNRVRLVNSGTVELSEQVVLRFPRAHRPRKRRSV